jgi:CRISPR-associated protein Csa1
MVAPSFVFIRWLRRLRGYSVSDPVDDDLRGWSWGSPPVRPRAYLGLSVSDVASYCPTRRDVWLRRVARVRGGEVSALSFGSAVHSVIHDIIKHTRRCFLVSEDDVWSCASSVVNNVLENYSDSNWFPVLKDIALTTYSMLVADYVWSLKGDGFQPFLGWLSEVRIDGSPIGLSRGIRADAIVAGNLVVDFKLGRRNEIHQLALTAYAMALEANLELPIDYGFIIYIHPNGGVKVSVDGIYISPDLRRDFIDARDEVIDILLSEREPPKAVSCHATCPYREVCSKK